MGNQIKIHPLIQDTVEALSVIGGTIKRFKRQLLVQQGELEKMIGKIVHIEQFIARREKEIKKMIEGEDQPT